MGFNSESKEDPREDNHVDVSTENEKELSESEVVEPLSTKLSNTNVRESMEYGVWIAAEEQNNMSPLNFPYTPDSVGALSSGFCADSDSISLSSLLALLMKKHIWLSDIWKQ